MVICRAWIVVAGLVLVGCSERADQEARCLDITQAGTDPASGESVHEIDVDSLGSCVEEEDEEELEEADDEPGAVLVR